MLSSGQVQGDQTPPSEQVEVAEVMVTILEEALAHKLRLKPQARFRLKFQKASMRTKEFPTIKLLNNKQRNKTLASNLKS